MTVLSLGPWFHVQQALELHEGLVLLFLDGAEEKDMETL